MSLEPLRTHWRRLDGWVRLAVAVWAAMTVAVCVRSVVQSHRQTLYPVWRSAGHDWRTGQDLYGEGGPASDGVWLGYRYSPLVAALLTPCDLVPEGVGNVVWRLLNAAAFLAALAWWLRDGVPLPTTAAQRGLVVLLTAPVALASLNNGQANLLLAALLLGCVTAVAVERWNVAAACAALAVLLKLFPIALVLLLVLAHPRRFAWRFVLALLLLSALPFLMQHPDYVARQYQQWWERIRHADVGRRLWPVAQGYRDLWMLIRVWGLPVSLGQYAVVQLAGAAGCAALVAAAIWRLGRGRRLLLVALTVASAWMLLLGPSPESCTYVLIAAPLAWWLVQTRREGRDAPHYLAAQGYGLLLWGVVTGTSSLGIALYHVPGLQPLAVLSFLGGFVATVFVWLREGRPTASAEPAPARRAA